ncbi:hypothetical protein KIN20_003001 [Parelaphostrongylus tenuis]|uniref:Uncharacterized protein n=1 Tax=Parelaphostrongylus tenuis TaxID=148309 RepID=A0AAD5QDY2_PARTN|nr:hypothetical protein KIN20_003001 [Parelaphostrongylus tenuis]
MMGQRDPKSKLKTNSELRRRRYSSVIAIKIPYFDHEGMKAIAKLSIDIIAEE